MEQHVEPYHSSRHLLSLVELAGLTHASTRAQPEHNLARRWGLEEDDLDLREVRSRLDKAWRQWPSEQRENVLITAEHVAFAERQKQLWNPKEHAQRYRRLSHSAIAVARQVEELEAMLPSLGDRERARMGYLVEELSAFVVGVLYATTFPQIRGSVLDATVRMAAARSDASDHRGAPPPWELIRDLVWLASNKQICVSERTIRRYLTESKPLKTPAWPLWKRHWGVVGPVAHRLARPQVRDVERMAKAYLHPAV